MLKLPLPESDRMHASQLVFCGDRAVLPRLELALVVSFDESKLQTVYIFEG
jgi:hypothetical protein